MASSTVSAVLSIPTADELEAAAIGSLDGYGSVDDVLCALRDIDELYNTDPVGGLVGTIQTPTFADLGALWVFADSIAGTARMFEEAAGEIRDRLRVLDQIRRDRSSTDA